jgi:hypothetical protein
MTLRVGDLVVKKKENWIENEFDAWGRGQGVGVICEPPIELSEDWVDVRWPSGRCFEKSSGLSIVQPNEDYDSTKQARQS